MHDDDVFDTHVHDDVVYVTQQLAGPLAFGCQHVEHANDVDGAWLLAIRRTQQQQHAVSNGLDNSERDADGKRDAVNDAHPVALHFTHADCECD